MLPTTESVIQYVMHMKSIILIYRHAAAHLSRRVSVTPVARVTIHTLIKQVPAAIMYTTLTSSCHDAAA